MSYYIAVAHCRVSKGSKEEIENSLRSQKSEITKLANKLNIPEDKIDWFIEEEARSSFSERANWEIFDKKIEEICKNLDIEYFLAFSQERFCRNSRRSKLYKEKLRAHGVKIRFVCCDVENPESMEGFVLDHTNEMVAQMYSMKVSADTMRGCLENASTRDPETGYVYKNGGQPPFWLMSKKLTIGKNKQGADIIKTIWIENTNTYTAIINNKPVTKTMWDWAKYYFQNLRLRQELSIKKARDVFNELGIPAPRGDKWENTCLYEAEKNVALYGLSIYNKHQYARGANGRIKDISEWVQEENGYPALITKEQYLALSELRKAKTRGKGKSAGTNSNNDKLFSNNPEKFYCKSCGGKIISSGDFYTCSKYNSQGKAGCGSSYFAVPALWLEEKVVNDIKNFFDEKILKKTYNDFIKSLEKQLKPDTSKISIIEKTIKQKEKDITSLVKTLTTMATSGNEIATKAIANELEKITKEKEKLESELNDIKQPDLIKIPSFNEFQNQSLITKALLSPGDISKKRKIIWMFVKSIILDPKEKAVTVEYYENPLKMLLEKETKTANSIHNKKGSLIKTSNELVAGIGFEPMTFGL